MKFIIILLFFTSSVFTAETTYSLNSAEISYKVEFPLKTVNGKTTEVKGKGICEKDLCDFLVAAEVKNFKSGDTNRDVHMQEVTKASQYPLVSVALNQINPKTLDTANLEIDFASVKKIIKNVKLAKSSDGKTTDISTKFKIKLSDFKIERPTLLGVAIDDEVEINVKTKWNNP